MAIMFSDMDLVPSDVAAGLMLLNREQTRKAQEEREESRVCSLSLKSVMH
jgi:hypothetical protein